MKAIKIASGVAIGALAAAISAQSFAMGHEGGAESTVVFSGSVKVQSVFDLNGEGVAGDPARTNQMPNNDDWYHLTGDTTVTHGPFSGKIRVGHHEGGPANVTVRDLKVEEGPISFGQVGKITDTVGKLEGLTDFRKAGETGMQSDELGVAGAFRYTLSDFGLRVQGEGRDADDFGFAAAIHQDFDVAQVWADFQYREVIGGSDADPITGYGVAAEVTPIDMLKLEAAFRGDSGLDDSAWAAKATVNVTDTISVYGQVASVSVDAEALAMRVGFSAGFAPITVSGWYAMDLADGADDTGRVFGKVAYADGPWGAFAETEVGLNDGEGVKVKVGGDYTTASGIKYGAEYENGDAADENVENSVATLFAQYSF